MTARAALLALVLAACGGPTSAPDAGADSGTVDAGVDAAGPRGRPERCNGVDDDLDGRRDEGCPVRLTIDEAHDVRPQLDGRRVVWSRLPATHMGFAGEIWTMELPDGAPRFVADGSLPSLSGDRVAFLRDGRLVVHDLSTGSETELEAEGADFLQAPHLDGDRVAWSQLMTGRDEDYEVRVHDLRSGARTRVAPNRWIQQFPRLEGQTVVFQDDRDGHHTVGLLHLFELVMVDLTDGALRPITMREDEQLIGSVAELSGGRVLTNESFGPLLPTTPRPRECVPVLYDIATGAREELAPRAIECWTARSMSGDRVVLERDPAGVSDLYLLSLSDGETRQVTDYPRFSTAPCVRGSWLVWQDDRNDHWDLYAMDLTDIDSGDFFPEGVAP